MDDLEGLNLQIHCLLARIESLEKLLTDDHKKEYLHLIDKKREALMYVKFGDFLSSLEVIEVLDRFLPEP
ncbi:hypothetical protein BCF58_0274 [Chryseobacterium defluvii]|uniref:Uncharacterized protein n=1 Tax=Chryseobacterium defluvii TaxID=160396 RepID=A0A495SLK9_9FLAO|nr:hypothetical protein BCF58_0274 [Chryseobacterium defluvii]